MTTANFALNSVYYLNSEHYEALHKEKEQSLVEMRSCKVREKRKPVLVENRQMK